MTTTEVDDVSYLLRYDGVARVTTVSEFVDPVEAERAYDAAERDLEAHPMRGVEFVLVAADALGTVRRTHGSYFAGQRVRTSRD